jgi:hypothetical protein
MSHRFILTARGLTHIPPQNYQLISFTFTVAGTAYHTTNLIADFLSLKVARLHDQKPTLDNFVLEIPDPHKDFTHFLALSRGEPIQITDENNTIFMTIAKLLKNPELFQFLAE